MDVNTGSQTTPVDGKQSWQQVMRSQPGIRFLLLWIIAALASAAVVAVLYEVVQDLGLRAALLVLTGVPLGLVQSLVLQTHFRVPARVTWTAGTALGWGTGMMLLLFFSMLTLAGSGINDVSDERIGQCLLQVWLVAGALAGYLQALYSGGRVFRPLLWGAVNAVAWSLGAVIGGLAAQAFNVIEDAPWFEVVATSAGLFAAIFAYGTVTGVAATVALRTRWRFEIDATTLDPSL